MSPYYLFTSSARLLFWYEAILFKRWRPRAATLRLDNLVHNLVAMSRCLSYLDATVRMYGVILFGCTIKHDRQSCVCIFVQTQYFRLRVRELKLATTNSHSSYWDGWDQLVGRALRHRPTRL